MEDGRIIKMLLKIQILVLNVDSFTIGTQVNYDTKHRHKE